MEEFTGNNRLITKRVQRVLSSEIPRSRYDVMLCHDGSIVITPIYTTKIASVTVSGQIQALQRDTLAQAQALGENDVECMERWRYPGGGADKTEGILATRFILTYFSGTIMATQY